MASLFENRFFNRTFAIDEISKRPQSTQLKFKRAFQFLQLLLIQRVYTLTAIACSTHRRLAKTQQEERETDHQHDFEVFLGGSCNPTTWRHDQAIPYFSSRSVSYYNPQVANWTPDLVEIEHRAKELAPLLFFVIDHDTRALASIVEVCYLAALGRNIIVVMSPMPELNSTKFIQNKSDHDLENDLNDYENACETRRISVNLLRSLSIPVFERIDSALECAAYILETTKRNMTTRSNNFHYKNESNDVLSPLPSSKSSTIPHSSSVVYIRSLSNKTSFDDPNEFYRKMRETNLSYPSVTTHVTQKTTLTSGEFQALEVLTENQISCSTHDSDDEGYGSFQSMNRALSSSDSSLSSESFEPTFEQVRDNESNRLVHFDKLNHWLSKFYSYLPFVGSNRLSMTNSMFVIFTSPFKFLQTRSFPRLMSSSSSRLESQSDEGIVEHFSSNKITTSYRRSLFSFDVYIAGGSQETSWLETIAFPTLLRKRINFVQRKSDCDDDQADITYDSHLRSKSRLLFYLINGEERLSDLTAELAFLIGQRKQKIIVYLEPKMSQTNKLGLTPCERRDLDRSRTYLLDVINKEHITLATSLDDSLEQILRYFDD